MKAPTLFVLAADLTKMQVNANLDESDVGRIRAGQVVTFRVDAYPAEEFVGAVSQVRLQPIVTRTSSTYATVIDVPNPQLKLKPGMTANVNIEIARRNDVLRVPNAALRFRPTDDMFAALNQAVPPEMQRGAGGGAARADRRRRPRLPPRRRRRRRLAPQPAPPAERPRNAQRRRPRRPASSQDTQRPAPARPGRPARQGAPRGGGRSAARWPSTGPAAVPAAARPGLAAARARTPEERRSALAGADGQHDARRARAVRGAHAGARDGSEQPRRRRTRRIQGPAARGAPGGRPAARPARAARPGAGPSRRRNRAGATTIDAAVRAAADRRDARAASGSTRTSS